MVGDFPELDCRRVAAVVHGEGGFQGFTPLAIHFRRVAAKTNAIVGGGGGGGTPIRKKEADRRWS